MSTAALGTVNYALSLLNVAAIAICVLSFRIGQSTCRYHFLAITMKLELYSKEASTADVCFTNDRNSY